MLGLDNSKEDNLVLSGSLEFSGNHKVYLNIKHQKIGPSTLFITISWGSYLGNICFFRSFSTSC